MITSFGKHLFVVILSHPHALLEYGPNALALTYPKIYVTHRNTHGSVCKHIYGESSQWRG